MSTNSPQYASRDTRTAREVLNDAMSIDGMTWPKLSRLLGVPGGTLWDIANGKPVPRKWRKRRSRDLYAMPISELRWAIRNRR